MDADDGRAMAPGWDGMQALPGEWELYKRLVGGVPAGIAVHDVAIGDHWVLVEAESGCGMALNVRGGRGEYALGADVLRADLRDLAARCASWNFLEASVGVAALNAWYSAPGNARTAGMRVEREGSNDGFELYRRACAGKRVCVVGHFPLVERLAGECELTVLERDPHGADYPDPACEFVIPHQDFTFITGVTLTNKTMPRLLQLARSSGGSAVLVGPSVVPAPLLFDYGVDCMAGAVIEDAGEARRAILHAASSGVFAHGVQKMRIERPGWRC